MIKHTHDETFLQFNQTTIQQFYRDPSRNNYYTVLVESTTRQMNKHDTIIIKLQGRKSLTKKLSGLVYKYIQILSFAYLMNYIWPHRRRPQYQYAVTTPQCSLTSSQYSSVSSMLLHPPA